MNLDKRSWTALVFTGRVLGKKKSPQQLKRTSMVIGSSSQCLDALSGAFATNDQKMSSGSQVACFMGFQEWFSDLELVFLSDQFV